MTIARARRRGPRGSARRRDGGRGLSFEVGHGEIVGLIGPNGAGKSSTLHAIMGAVRPAGGDVRVNGISVVGRRPEDVARRGVALVPEGRRIFAELTVEENLRLGLAGRRRRDGVAEDMRQVYDLFPVVEEARTQKGRDALRRSAAAACDRAGAGRGSRGAAPRRALARSRATHGRPGLRGARRDPRAWPRDSARRAACTTHGRVRRPVAVLSKGRAAR